MKYIVKHVLESINRETTHVTENYLDTSASLQPVYVNKEQAFQFQTPDQAKRYVEIVIASIKKRGFYWDDEGGNSDSDIEGVYENISDWFDDNCTIESFFVEKIQ